ncbi:MAG: hypothetical protein ACI4XJ_06285, partial [Eubacteriales bacterium]
MENNRSISEEALRWVGLYEKKHGEGSAEKIIMTDAEIAKYNKKIVENCPTVYDMTSPPDKMSGNEVRKMINKYS